VTLGPGPARPRRGAVGRRRHGLARCELRTGKAVSAHPVGGPCRQLPSAARRRAGHDRPVPASAVPDGSRPRREQHVESRCRQEL